MSILYSYAIEPLDKAQELGLAEKAAGGDKQARETLIRANIRYALSYAKTFYGHGLSNEDIDEEAIIGLIKAIDNFDYKRGYKIITYAKMYIMNEIMHASNYSGYVMRQSDERFRTLMKIKKALRRIYEENNQSKLLDSLAYETGLDKKVITELLEQTQPCTALEEQQESNYEAPETAAIYEVLVQGLYSKLSELDPLERQVICMTYGLEQYKKPYSMGEIGKNLGRSKQYIFYIKEKAIDKLKMFMKGESLAA